MFLMSQAVHGTKEEVSHLNIRAWDFYHER
jgi:hypothetical protein